MSLKELYNYFKEKNEVENGDIEIVINLNDNNHDDVLNAPIPQAEIGMNGDEFHYLFICQCNEVAEIRN